MKKSPKFLMTLMVVMLLMVVATIPVQAAARETTTVTNIMMQTNETKNISIKNASAKITWASSNDQIVKIDKTYGKYQQNAIFCTQNKAGTCTVKATVENKVYKYQVTVKKGTVCGKYTGKKSKVELVNVSPKTCKIRVRMCNAKNGVSYYGHAFYLKKYVNGKWKTVAMKEDIGFDALAITIPAKHYVSLVYDLSTYYEKSQLTSGTYRIYVNFNGVKAANSYANFKL